MTKAKSKEQIERFDAIMRKLSKAEQRTIAQFGRDKIEQGKKDVIEKIQRDWAISEIDEDLPHERWRKELTEYLEELSKDERRLYRII